MNPIDMGQPLGITLALLPEVILTGWSLIVLLVVSWRHQTAQDSRLAGWLSLAGLLVTGTVGFASVGTLFAAMLVRAQSRDVLLPVVLYPLTIPVIILGVQGTGSIFAVEPDLALAGNALAMLVFFDAVFVTLALWTFAHVMRD